MQTLWQDLRYSARMLRKQPGFTAVVMLTLALGIGANTAIFSVVNAVLLRPLPYRAPDRLVALWETKLDDDGRLSRGTAANILDWQAQNDVFDEMAMFGSGGGNLTGDGAPEQVLGARVSEGYFRVLGVEPMLGRVFAPDEHVPGADRVIIIYYDLWQRRFGGAPDVIGRTFRMDDTPYTIVGVMPPGIYPTWPATQAYIRFLPRYQQLWVPMALTPEQAAIRSSHVMGTILGFQDRVLERIQSVAGVRSAAFTYDHPLDATWGDVFRIEGRPEPEPGRMPGAWLRPISPGYFRTAGIELLRGRTITDTDDLDHPGAVVVNEAFVRRYFPEANEEPLGQKLRLQSHWRFPGPEVFEIVGIVRDVHFPGPDVEPAPAYYRPFKQFPDPFQKVMVKTDTDPLSAVGQIREAVWAVDPNLPIGGITTMAQHYDAALAQPRFNMLLLALFGGLALLLAAIGVYGLLSYRVAQRTQEIGVRMALGAQLRDVVGMVVGEGLWLTGLGVGAGLVGAFALTRVLGSLLFGVSPVDVQTFVTVTIALATIALLASYLPARRAAKVDPMVALRTE